MALLAISIQTGEEQGNLGKSMGWKYTWQARVSHADDSLHPHARTAMEGHCEDTFTLAEQLQVAVETVFGEPGV